MLPETRRALNAINHAFYVTTADEFDQTRGSAWAGWERLLPHLPPHRPLRVLDVGCGNGRFGVFLHERLHAPLIYHGQDSSPALLGRARAALTGRPDLAFQLEQRDIVEQPPDAGAYDVVGLFGVLHHIPGAAERLALVRTLVERVTPDGLLIFATWRFVENDRLRARIVAWPPDLAGQVDTGDYLLDWRRGTTALRYCHAVDDAEQESLVRASALTEIERYRADGQDSRLNAYSVLRRAP
jgi:SAM-dependent methyltransferase